MTGTFGRLTVIEQEIVYKSTGGTLWKCKCSCGKIVIVKRRYLRDGSTKSCGCLKRDVNKAKVKIVMSTCHLDREHHARGLCKSCYNCAREKSLFKSSVQFRERKAKYNKKWRIENPLAYRNIALRSHHNTSREAYNLLYIKQDKKCAICEEEGFLSYQVQYDISTKNKKKLCLDHNHNTLVNRGLLCIECNSLLRGFDNKEWKLKAEAYLQKYE
jgi:hypothetical protein